MPSSGDTVVLPLDGGGFGWGDEDWRSFSPTRMLPREGLTAGRYVTPIALKDLPSPLTGEGSGGGGSRASSPPSPPSPARGEGVFTSPCQPLVGEGK
jgi:hypothetical protein